MWSKIIFISCALNFMYDRSSANPKNNSFNFINVTGIRNSANQTTQERTNVIEDIEVAIKQLERNNKLARVFTPSGFLGTIAFAIKELGLHKIFVKSDDDDATAGHEQRQLSVSPDVAEGPGINATLSDQWGVFDEEFDEKAREDGYKITTPEENPYAVLVLSISKNGIQERCSGTLLTLTWVLTAAHCLRKPGDKEVTQVYIFAGINSAAEIEAGNIPRHAQRLPASSWATHPNYQDYSPVYDVGVVRVSGSFVQTSTVSPIRLTSKPWTGGGYKRCRLTGFGQVYSFKPSRDDFKRKTHYLYVQKPCTCYPKQDPKRSLICSWRVEDHGVCFGDSGAGLVCDGELSGVVVALQRTVSHDSCALVNWNQIPPQECGTNKVMSLFLNVCPFVSWMNWYVYWQLPKPTWPQCGIIAAHRHVSSSATAPLASPSSLLLSTSSSSLLSALGAMITHLVTL